MQTLTKVMLIFILLSGSLISCKKTPKVDYIRGLNSCNVDSICISCYYLGERKDKDAVKYLLNGMNDTRISHHIQHKGMSVYYCRAIALRKISGLDLPIHQQAEPDTALMDVILKWALKNKLISSRQSIILETQCK